MSDDSRGTSTPPNKRTVEIYRDLLQVEVRALVSRVSELTQTVGSLFGEVHNLALQLEESVDTQDRLAGGLTFCREEISVIRRSLGRHETALDELRQQVVVIEEKMMEFITQSDNGPG